MIPVLAQIVQRLPGYLIERLAGEKKIKARAFSYSSQLYLLMLGQFLHAFSMNEIVDIAEVHRRKLSRIRGIGPAKLNTFSNANRTRDPSVAESFYWALRDLFGSQSPGFRSVRNRVPLARFRMRHVYAIDASVIPLALSSIDWASYVHRKVAAKLHMRTNVANMLPDFVVIDSVRRHEARNVPSGRPSTGGYSLGGYAPVHAEVPGDVRDGHRLAEADHQPCERLRDPCHRMREKRQRLVPGLSALAALEG